MVDWIKELYSDVLTWLMERSDPAVRYWTLTKLLGLPEWNVEVVEAQYLNMERGPASWILAHYAGEGRWEEEKSYAMPKYTAAHWQLLLLAEVGADGHDARIAEACRRMIADVAKGRQNVTPCFYGNLVGYLHALGHAQDEQVRQFEEALAAVGVADKWRCVYNGDQPCAWGAARALWGIGRIPADQRSEALRAAVESGVRFLGRFKLCEGNYPSSGSRHELWSQLNFPLFYQADVLFTLRALADLGLVAARPSFRKAAAWLESRRRPDGRWDGASPYNNRLWAPLEERRHPSKWITWQALYVLKTTSVAPSETE